MKALCMMALAGLALAGCNHGDAQFHHLGMLDTNHVLVYAHDGTDAIVSRLGNIDIDGKTIALDTAQARLVARYFARAMALHDTAIKTGATGVDTTTRSIAIVAQAFASGGTDSIDAKTGAAASQVCHDLQALQKAQDDLAAALAQFKPYATITAREVDACKAGQ